MKKCSCFIYLLLFVLVLSLHAQAQPRSCGTMSHLQELQQQDPGLAARMQAAQDDAQAWQMQHAATAKANGTLTIPVVFHVVYKLQSQIPPRPRLLDQLRVLNEDYSGTNPEFPNVPAAWSSVAAHSGIQFCLARQDPQGDTTGGITYTQTAVTSFSTNDAVKHASQGGHDAWDPTRYLNIWVCNLGNGLLSYAQFPGGPAATDGVVLSHLVAGPTGNANSPYNLGRSATHDIAHWLGLFHISDCNNNDLCNDTPGQTEVAYGCHSFPYLDSCTQVSPGIMFMNFINLSDDSCSIFFTNDQAARMLGFLNTARSSLLTSTVCDSVVTGVPAPTGLALAVFPNPSQGRFQVGFSATGEAEISVHDVLGRALVTRSLMVDGPSQIQIALPQGSSAGVYFVRVQVDGLGVMRRVVVE